MLDDATVARFCRAHRIRRFAFFGSVLRSDFGPTSDIDVLVEFEPGARATFFDLVAMEDELSQLLGRKVDIRTPNELSPHFRDDVLATAEVRYAAG